MRLSAKAAAAALAATLSVSAVAQQAPINPANLPSPLPTNGITDTGGITTTGPISAGGQLMWSAAPSTGNSGNGGAMQNVNTYNSPTYITRTRYMNDVITNNGTTGDATDEGLYFGRVFGGTGVYSSERNGIHVFLQDAGTATFTGANMENFEASTSYSGAHANTQDYLALMAFGTNATLSGTSVGYSTSLFNANTTPGSIAEYDAINITALIGGGSAPARYDAIRIRDNNANISAQGHVQIGGNLDPPATVLLGINGPDTSNSTYLTFMKNSAGGFMFYVTDAGNAIFGTSLQIGGVGAQAGALTLASATAGASVKVIPTAGVSLGSEIVFLPPYGGTLNYNFNIPGGAGLSGFGGGASTSGTVSTGFLITAGTGPTNTGTITFGQAAQTGYACDVTDKTSVGSIIVRAVPTSTTVVTVTGYSATTGAPAAFNANDVLVANCQPF